MTGTSASASGWKWRGLRDSRPPRVQLAAVVCDLTRARRNQVLLELCWAGLFWGLVAGTAWVLATRLLVPVDNPWPGVGCALALGLAVAFVLAWRRRPDDLEVAIRADLELNLEQALSTAWELERKGRDPVLVDRIARSALASYRLPRRGDEVFSAGATRHARVLPLAAVALLMVVVVDVPPVTAPEVPVLDPVVVEEGRRLRDFALRMETRARREALQRTEAGAETVQRLGSRMHDGALTRSEALVRLRDAGAALREQTRLATTEGGGMPLGRQALESLAASPLLQGGQLRDLLEKMLAGGVDGERLEQLRQEAMTLSSLGIDSEELREALRRFAEGDEEELRVLLERLEKVERAVREVHELQEAEKRVLLARENLGDPENRIGKRVGGMNDGPRSEEDAETYARDPRGTDPHGPPDSRVAMAAAGLGVGGGAPVPGSGRRGTDKPGGADGGVIKPVGRPGEGRVHVTEARVLPRAGAPALDTVNIDRRFASQVEEVLAKEEIPLHERELIRRYFLSLSAPGAEQP